jgi:hypothetical protein
MTVDDELSLYLFKSKGNDGENIANIKQIMGMPDSLTVTAND